MKYYLVLYFYDVNFFFYEIYLKEVNAKSIVLINCRKINHQQKICLLCASNLMERFLNHLNLSDLGWNRKKLSGLMLNFWILFWAGPEPEFSGPCRLLLPINTLSTIYKSGTAAHDHTARKRWIGEKQENCTLWGHHEQADTIWWDIAMMHQKNCHL